MADAPTGYCFKNNTLSRTQNSGFEMCSGVSGCITYGKCCPRKTAMKPLKGSKIVAVREAGFSWFLGTFAPSFSDGQNTHFHYTNRNPIIEDVIRG